jgi:hypothetical protein
VVDLFEENPEYFLDKVVEKVKQETRKHGVNYNLVHLCKIAKAFNIEVVDFLPKK